jgi:nitroimidazol reductase NimA-like FMN-containing flavoprotein (pyridoxamine 5'-phosphate oxidase superfamily)
MWSGRRGSHPNDPAARRINESFASVAGLAPYDNAGVSGRSISALSRDPSCQLAGGAISWKEEVPISITDDFSPSPRRGQVRRTDRVVPAEDAWRLLEAGQFAHVGVLTPDGWPYVVPLVYVTDADRHVWLHTTRSRRSLFLQAVRANPRVCVTVSIMGSVIPGIEFACDSSLQYASVVAFGTADVLDDDEARKTWFFDQLWAKYGPADWVFRQSGYPRAGSVVLYRVTVETLTGKANHAPSGH